MSTTSCASPTRSRAGAPRAAPTAWARGPGMKVQRVTLISACLGVASGSPAGAQMCSQDWAPVGAGAAGGLSYPAVLSLETADLGSGPALYAGGNFTHMDGLGVN